MRRRGFLECVSEFLLGPANVAKMRFSDFIGLGLFVWSSIFMCGIEVLIALVKLIFIVVILVTYPVSVLLVYVLTKLNAKNQVKRHVEA